MTYAIVIFFVGLALSAFFSGSETGFYRAPRLRMVIDGVGGDRVARGLLWATNHPEAFVATALVGNNVANYFVSSAIVLFAGGLVPRAGLWGEMGFTLLLAPVVFIFGELLPKRAFLQAPYRLLRRCAGGLLAAAVVLAAPSSLLWLASRGLSLVTGSKIVPLRMAVRRRELTDAFQEGEAVGLLASAQRDLAMSTFSLGATPLRDYMTPLARQPRLPNEATSDDVVRLARRHEQDAWPLETAAGGPAYVRASRVLTAEDPNAPLPVEDLVHFDGETPFLRALTELESNGQPLAAVTGAAGRVIGFVRVSRLQDALWSGS